MWRRQRCMRAGPITLMFEMLSRKSIQCVFSISMYTKAVSELDLASVSLTKCWTVRGCLLHSWLMTGHLASFYHFCESTSASVLTNRRTTTLSSSMNSSGEAACPCEDRHLDGDLDQIVSEDLEEAKGQQKLGMEALWAEAYCQWVFPVSHLPPPTDPHQVLRDRH